MNSYIFCLGISMFFATCAWADRECLYGWGPMGPGLGGVFMLILLLIAVALVVYFLVRASKERGLGSSYDSPMELLKRRYARGEISKEKFEEMKKDLKD